MPKIPTRPPAVVVPPSGRTTIRPLYGVFIRDNLAKFRTEIGSTLDQTKRAIAKGDPKGREVAGDGVLQGTELTKAKAAVKDLEMALKAIKGGAPTGIGAALEKAVGSAKPGGSNVIRPLYGVVFRDDLAKFRDGINSAIDSIHGGMASLKPAEKAEAKKALASLQAALKDLGSARRAWN